MSENDFESPGYEYLRLYQNMNNLYYKLTALNYQKDFCSVYKCPPIHRYYFSLPNENANEQQFIFTCLCAWLIKDKCQMNLELEPEEYEDVQIVINVIIEALGLLLGADDTNLKSKSTKSVVSFPPGRLKSGYGPEVVWTMNVFADRALEMLVEEKQQELNRRMKVVYFNKNNPPDATENANYITVGQPFVGGGLTTRPLGSYKIDDRSLLFDSVEEDTDMNDELQNQMSRDPPLEDQSDSKNWYLQVQAAASALETANLVYDKSGFDDLQTHLKMIKSSRDSIEEFSTNSKPILVAITNRVDRQMQLINGREKFIQTNMKSQIEEFLKTYRLYLSELNRNNQLVDQVMRKTDKFESYNDELYQINAQVELRIRELNDGSKLRELESMINLLEKENGEFDLKIGLLLTLYAKRVTESLNEREEGYQ